MLVFVAEDSTRCVGMAHGCQQFRGFAKWIAVCAADNSFPRGCGRGSGLCVGPGAGVQVSRSGVQFEVRVRDAAELMCLE